MEEAAKSERVERFGALFDDHVAFRRWYDETLSVVYPFVYARCGGDQTLAMEITQETFVEGVRARESFGGDAEPVTWLCSIARNKIADHFRRLGRERRRLVRLVYQEQVRSIRPRQEMEDHYAVAEALGALSPQQRAVLTMHYLDGMPVREIATALGRTGRAVESLLARAREGFRRAYGDGGRHER